MKKVKKEKLAQAGWRVGDAQDFLGLSDEEVSLIETKRALMRMLKEARKSNRVTQARLAQMINSSQSRVAKMEAASGDVSLDLVFRALFALGVSHEEVAQTIAKLKP